MHSGREQKVKEKEEGDMTQKELKKKTRRKLRKKIQRIRKKCMMILMIRSNKSKAKRIVRRFRNNLKRL